MGCAPSWKVPRVERPGAEAGRGRRRKQPAMSDTDVQRHIEQLVAEEHKLLGLAEERGLEAAERARLDAVNVELDRYYDLLRQRRAREEFGQDPETAHLSPEDTVEKYLQ